ncbi:MAG: DNA helicase PriA [Methanomicrobiales archaeon]|nr:DNA helicase PriA [Methanomicrobiales archaeon]MDI6877127.1 DNA helicase PriA [Methanomicrobiales archaeon]
MLRHSCGFEANIHCKKCGGPLEDRDRIGLFCPRCGRRVTAVCPGCGKLW